MSLTTNGLNVTVMDSTGKTVLQTSLILDTPLPITLLAGTYTITVTYPLTGQTKASTVTVTENSSQELDLTFKSPIVTLFDAGNDASSWTTNDPTNVPIEDTSDFPPGVGANSSIALTGTQANYFLILGKWLNTPLDVSTTPVEEVWVKLSASVPLTVDIFTNDQVDHQYVVPSPPAEVWTQILANLETTPDKNGLYANLSEIVAVRFFIQQSGTNTIKVSYITFAGSGTEPAPQIQILIGPESLPTPASVVAGSVLQITPTVQYGGSNFEIVWNVNGNPVTTLTSAEPFNFQESDLGTYQVTATITDLITGASNTSNTATVTVCPPPPTCSLDYHYNIAQAACIKTPSCPVGQHWNVATGECVPDTPNTIAVNTRNWMGINTFLWYDFVPGAFETLADLIASAGATCLRLQTRVPDTALSPPGGYATWLAYFQAELIPLLKERGIKLIIGTFPNIGPGNGWSVDGSNRIVELVENKTILNPTLANPNGESVSAGDAWIADWGRAITALQPDVIQIFNEPGTIEWSQYAGEITPAQFFTDYITFCEKCIDAWTAIKPDIIVSVMNAPYFEYISRMIAQPVQRPNVYYSIHPYMGLWGNPPNWGARTQWEYDYYYGNLAKAKTELQAYLLTAADDYSYNIKGMQAAGLPVVMEETGCPVYYPNALVFMQDIYDILKANNVGVIPMGIEDYPNSLIGMTNQAPLFWTTPWNPMGQLWAANIGSGTPASKTTKVSLATALLLGGGAVLGLAPVVAKKLKPFK